MTIDWEVLSGVLLAVMFILFTTSRLFYDLNRYRKERRNQMIEMKPCCGTCENVDKNKETIPCSKCIYNSNYISHYKMHKAVMNMLGIMKEKEKKDDRNEN